MNFIDGFKLYTNKIVEKKRNNVVIHSVKMAGFPRITTLQEFDFLINQLLTKVKLMILLH